MGQAIGEMLPAAIGVAISPLPIVAVVLMLVTPRASTNGPAFLLGWWAGVAVVGTIVLLAASGSDASEEGQPANWVGLLKLVLGIVLLSLAASQWLSRPSEGEEPEMPGWMKALDTFTPLKSFGIAFVLAGLNPKNLLLVVAGAAAIAGTGISTEEQAGALIVFVLISSLGVLVPVALYFALGDRSREMLGEMKDWMSRNNATIMAVLLLILGMKLIGDGIAILT